MMLRIFKVIVLFFLFLSIVAFSPQANSVVESCSVSVTPTSLTVSTSETLTFNLQNTGSVNYVWVKITRPNSGFTINGGSATRWTASTSTEYVTFTGWTVGTGASTNFSVGVTTGSSSQGSQAWIVEVSDDSEGASAFTCSGSTGVAITGGGGGGGGDTTPPTISGITVSNVSSSQATISWTTNEDANSTIDFGTDTNYGTQGTDSTNTTSHSLALSGLTANTTYHYQVSSTDSSSNESSSGDNTFTTAIASLTATPTPASTSQSTSTTIIYITPTPTPKSLPDRTRPKIIFLTDLSKSFSSSPLIIGEANDPINNVATADYSLDGGENWLPATMLSKPGKKVQFQLQPEFLEDGNYELLVRAHDITENKGYSDKRTLVIDRLPPIVGGSLVSVGPQVIPPQRHGVINTITNVPHLLTISAVGGPSKIDIVTEKYVFPLKKSEVTGLWSGVLKFDKTGTFPLIAKSIDGAGNKTERTINTFAVMEKGSVVDSKNSSVPNATISVYLKDTELLTWTLWDSIPYLQTNPQKTDKNGNFTLFLPSGTYYLMVQKNGFKTTISNEFTLNSQRVLNPKIRISNKFNVKIGPLSFYVPDLIPTSQQISFPNFENKIDGENILNSQLPLISIKGKGNTFFDPLSLRGKNNIITFVSIWSPPAIEQISILENLYRKNPKIPITVIISQDNFSRVELFQKRGGYQIPLFTDQDGKLINSYKVMSYPEHFVVNKKGIITKIYNSILSEKEINDILKNNFN